MESSSSWRIVVLVAVAGILVANPARPQDATNAAAPTSSPAARPASGSDPDSYVKFGIANGKDGKLDDAIAAFNKALAIDPNYAPAYQNRGLAHALQHKTDDAIADYNRTVQLDPKNAEAFYQRGTLKGQEGDFDGAIADFSEVITLNTKYAPAFYNRGHALYFKGDLDNALTDINQGISMMPDFSYSYFIRGLIRHAQGDSTEASADFQKSAGFGYPYAAFWYWITRTEDGERALARQDLSNALSSPDEFKPDDWSTVIGTFLVDRISQDQLIAKAKQAPASEVPNRLCEAWFYIGMSQRLAGNVKGAQDSFTQAIATGAKGAEEYIEASRQLANP